MTTDKDREDAKNIKLLISCFLVEGDGNPDNDIPEYVSRIRAESAEQTRKEAAERVSRAWREHGEDITLRIIRDAILGDSVIKENLTTDHIPDTEKLAIAVNALEEIVLPGNHKAAIAEIALKEIQ